MRRWGAVGLLVVLATTACGATTPVAVGTPSVSTAPTPTPTPIRTPTPTPVKVTTPSDPITYGMTEGVVRNKLYTAGKVSVMRCALPRPELTTKTGLLAYGKVLVACMSKAWAPLVQKSDAVLADVELIAYSARHPKATPECTDPPAYADAFYYFGGFTGKICFDADTFLGSRDQEFNLVDFEQLIAHEYGHHVQYSVGILTLYDELMRGKSPAGQYEVMRRKELQASCLGAAFLGANRRLFGLSGERLSDWRYVVNHVGDEYSKVRDHGSRKNHAYWTTHAFTAADPKACNTFTAPAGKVA
ncbi:neutral zinc metallopeptidase [Kribbella jejuensis]|uniref:Putative neutral zinc metallopeptidase n=1 Tax=Kribbella jejuensis TaxID=236068 RepID=A0A542E7N0_9ACTN|nr:neutral zinc metallopeptidase [Kribbella jejuensis]TQJ11324.1 putative neutral zinc metallopeptidase [Kribbella jejuensis]